MATWRALGRQMDQVMARQMSQAERVAALQALRASKSAASKAAARVTVRLDRREFDRNYTRTIANMGGAEQEVLGAGITAFTRHLMDHAPYDTRRFRRAYPEAANQLGLGPFFVEPVRPSMRNGQRERLVEQFNKWQYFVERAERAGRTHYKGVKKSGPDASYQRAKKNRDRAARILAEWDAMDADTRGTALIIGGRKGARGLSSLATLRTKVYGGEGRWVDTPRGMFAQVHNKEPHASIVQKNTRVVSGALHAARTVSRTRRVSNAYVRKLARGTTWNKAA